GAFMTCRDNAHRWAGVEEDLTGTWETCPTGPRRESIALLAWIIAMLKDDDIQAVHKLNEAYRKITQELGKRIVGQQEVIEQLMICLFAQGHCLLVGVPGLAKTLMIRTLADTLSLKFSRIQFTPDLMPSDITGTEVIQEDRHSGT